MRINNKKLDKNFIILSILLLLICSLPSAYGEDYYADISIDIDESGFVTIDGITNHPNLLVENTEIYSFKKQSFWLLNISKAEIFSDYIFKLTLPEDSSINYIKSSGSIRIEEEFGNLIIRGFGQNESFFIKIQYQIKKNLDTGFIDFYTLFFLVFLILILSIFLFSVFNLMKKRKQLEIIKKPFEDNSKNKFIGLTNRQKSIMELLIDRDRPLTQKEIQQELDLPKAAISRNIHSLQIKGLIEIEKIGMSNLISVKKP